ncbi:MAG: ATP-binding protein [Candidatus Kryptoniota bacterium]
MNRLEKIEEKKIFKSSTDSLSEVRAFVTGNARKFGFGEKEASEISLAVDEACTNVIKHAYKGKKGAQFEVIIRAHKSEFSIIVRDWGLSFDPASVPVPNVREYARIHKRGGLGIYLMKKLMDSVEYREKEAVNEVRLVRYLKDEPEG